MTRVFTGPVVAHDVVPRNRPLFAVKQHHCQPNFFRNHESIAWLDEAGIGRLSRHSASLSYRYNNLMPHALAFYVGRNTPVYYVQSMWQKVA